MPPRTRSNTTSGLKLTHRPSDPQGSAMTNPASTTNAKSHADSSKGSKPEAHGELSNLSKASIPPRLNSNIGVGKMKSPELKVSSKNDRQPKPTSDQSAGPAQNKGTSKRGAPDVTDEGENQPSQKRKKIAGVAKSYAQDVSMLREGIRKAENNLAIAQTTLAELKELLDRMERDNNDQ
ncbi:hypothetical protein K474DRAFT_1680392 [Panus rudis PR-1116 ss-1]|nr:hypothetical protein K474DRAFT_1680392 [Panus rudis PR-1116 ss-1]